MEEETEEQKKIKKLQEREVRDKLLDYDLHFPLNDPDIPFPK